MSDRAVYLYVTPFFPSPDNWRGAYCFDFVRALQRIMEKGANNSAIPNSSLKLQTSFNVLVFVPGNGGDYEIGGVKVHRFPTKQLPSNIFPFLFRRYNEKSFLNKVKEVLNSTLQLQLETTANTATNVAVCHAHTANFAIYALAAKRAFGCQAMLHHHCLSSFGLNMGVLRHCWLYNMILFPQLRRLHEQIDCHVFISEKVRDSFLAAPNTDWTTYLDYKRQMRGLPYRPVRINCSIILYNGVDTSIFHPLPQPQPKTSTFTIGCIGNFTELKNQAVLIRAVALLKEPVKVVFVGSGPTLETCKKLANSIVDLHLQPTPIFKFRTEVPHEQLADFYHSLDLFVLPSIFEGLGCVYPEAWACGVPFMAPRDSAVGELLSVDEKNRWLFESKVDLSENIRYYMQHRGCQRLSQDVSTDCLVGKFVKELAL